MTSGGPMGGPSRHHLGSWLQGQECSTWTSTLVLWTFPWCGLERECSLAVSERTDLWKRDLCNPPILGSENLQIERPSWGIYEASFDVASVAQGRHASHAEALGPQLLHLQICLLGWRPSVQTSHLQFLVYLHVRHLFKHVPCPFEILKSYFLLIYINLAFFHKV